MKSYVSMEAKVCPVCGKKHETNAILLDRRLRESMDRETVTGFALCQEHEEQKANGYVFIVGVDHERSDHLPNGNIDVNGAWRTGEIVSIRRSAWHKVVHGLDVPEVMVFAGSDVINTLARIAAEAHGGGKNDDPQAA